MWPFYKSEPERKSIMTTKERDAKLKLEAELMKPKVLAEQHKRLCDFIEEHKKDSETYEFRCERHGDFLAVFITRGEEQVRTSWSYQPNKIVAAISLINDKTIELREGNYPDTSATARFNRWSKYTEDLKEYEYSVVQDYYPNSSYRYMLVTDSPSQAPHMWHTQDGRFLGVTLTGCAAPAVDDKIRFEGSGVTIYVPFGKGKAVYDKILKAIKAGAR